jgi:serine acetyltransferase
MKRLLSEIRSDWEANHGNPKSALVLVGFRVAHRFARRSTRDPLFWAGLPLLVAYRVGVEWGLGVEIPAKTHVGTHLRVSHGQGLVVHKDTVLGDHCHLQHNTTIGRRGGPHDVPVIGNGVEIGANAVVLGPIRIGDDARIGAGAVVLTDVPAGATAVGNPARILPRREA